MRADSGRTPREANEIRNLPLRQVKKTPVRQLSEAGPEKTATYIADMLVELEKMAADNGHQELALMLKVATEEAQRVAGTSRHN